MLKVVKKETIVLNCTICNAELGPFLQTIQDGKDIAPPLELLRTTKVDVTRLSGEERTIWLCFRCCDFLEKKLKLGWAELTKLILQERSEEETAKQKEEKEEGY